MQIEILTDNDFDEMLADTDGIDCTQIQGLSVYRFRDRHDNARTVVTTDGSTFMALPETATITAVA